MSDYSYKLSKNGVILYYLNGKKIAKGKIPKPELEKLELEILKTTRKSPPKQSPKKSPSKTLGIVKSPPRSLITPELRPKESMLDQTNLERSTEFARENVLSRRRLNKEEMAILDNPPPPLEITEYEVPKIKPLRTWSIPLQKSPPQKRITIGGEKPRSPANRSPVKRGGLAKHGPGRPRDYDWLLFYWERHSDRIKPTKEDIEKFEREYGLKYPYDNRTEILSKQV